VDEVARHNVSSTCRWDDRFLEQRSACGAQGPLVLSNIKHSWGTVRVYGQEVETVRAATGKVRFRSAPANPVTGNLWPTSRYLVGDWAIIEPPAAGTHEIEIVGGDGYGFKVAVHATIHVS
jgi:hypothetical protein